MSTSIGYTNGGIGGSNTAWAILAKDPTSSGGAIKGWMPPTTVKVDKRYADYEQIRQILKFGWNVVYKGQLRRDGLRNPIQTPFRAVMNAGDLMVRQNYSCGGPCQTFQSRPGLHGLRGQFGSIGVSCVPSAMYNSLQMLSNIPASACNTKWVYDSSDYTRYMKERAVLRNFNDITYGGDDYKASQSAWRAIRRY